MDANLLQLLTLAFCVAMVLGMYVVERWRQRAQFAKPKPTQLRPVTPLRAPTEAERRAVRNCAERLAYGQPVQSHTERWTWNAKHGRWDVCLELTLVSEVREVKVCGTVEI